jgi:hypothetical protein
MVHLLADVVSWKDADDESYFAITEILKFMQGMECMDFALRQNPADDCILQQTTDGGDTWTDVFDFSQCVTIQDKSYQISIQNQVTNVQETFIDIYNNYTANYSGVPSSVYPALEQPAPGTDDSALKAALCNAVWELVRTACNAAVSFYNESFNQSQQEFNFLLAIAGFTFTALALAAAIPSAGASLVALGGASAAIAAGVGLGAGLGNYLLDFWQQHTIDQFQDTEAMESVACYLVDCLEGTDVSLADFRDCADGVMGSDANAQAILDFVQILFEHDSTYAAFLEKWNNNKQYADAGIDLYCPCADQYRVQVYNFADGGMQGWAIDTLSIASTHGVWDGNRWKGTLTQFNEKNIEIHHVFDPTWRIKGMKLHLTRENGLGDGSRDTSNAIMRPTPNSGAGQTIIQASGFQANGDVTPCANRTASPFYWTGANQLFVSAQVAENSGAGQIYINKIEIMYVADFAPSSGYLTDDDDLCT